MKTKVTVVCENTSPIPGLIGEYGLSMMIESDSVTLFDTGQGLGIINNLNTLGKNIASIEKIILSHGHFDHTGGLLSVLQNYSGNLPVYLHPEAYSNKIALIETPNGNMEIPAGIPFPRDVCEKEGAEFKFINGFTEIRRGLFAISDVKRAEGWQTWDVRLKVKEGNEIKSDPFNDDLSLLIETESGPVVLLGCAHAGIIEILDNIKEETGHKEFHAVIGGTHLGTAPEEYVQRAMDTLESYNVKIIGATHCTGFNIACRMARRFKERFINATGGTAFEF